MIRSFGDEYAEGLLAALSTTPSVSVRANILKGCSPKADADIVSWCKQGFYLNERPLFAADPAWHQGLYYVQDASSMVYGEVVKHISDNFFSGRGGIRYLDACAAPGGKTIAAIEALPNDALIVANEYDRHRANILLENIAKEGAANVVVSRGDATCYLKHKSSFDIIAVDAPCSGEGMMRKEPEAIRQWSEALIKDCAKTQQNIINALWAALKPGGVMIYSTCTFNRSENEEQLKYIADALGGESINLGLDKYEGVCRGFDTALHCYRFAPGHVRGEGLFIGAMMKPGACETKPARIPAKQLSPFSQQHILKPELFTEICTDDKLVLRSAVHSAFIADLCKTIDIIRSGLTVATIKGRDYIPSHDLALSSTLVAESFPHINLDYAGAISYLRGESLSELPCDSPIGYIIAQYQNRPLGFLKNIGRRANNNYPDFLRLRLDSRALPVEAPIPLIVLS
ncbi:MAG: hypothetical protein J1F05_01820 [Muribaculaceae bacterium]|nr:hypothetical protein [Muribaculaceae bacterium]